MLAELRKYGGGFALATQSLAYLDRLDRTLRATVLANIDHLFAFHIAGEDARLLHELDGIGEDDITSLDDFQCYVKLSLGGHGLPVFSLALDAPPLSDEQLELFVRLRSRGRDARPAGAVDELIKQSQARQRSAASTRQRMSSRSVNAGAEVEDDSSGKDIGSGHRHKKRGSGSQRIQEERVAPVHLHLMYREEEEHSAGNEEEEQQETGDESV